MTPKLIWGIPIRLFHWSLVILLGISLYTGQFGDFDSIDTHMLSGYGVLALLIFRVSFGFIAKGYERFSQFVRGPRAVKAYIKSPQATPGHNPLGAISVIALLLALVVQVGTGLFATDDIFVEGPLYHLVSSDTASTLTSIHSINRWIVLGLIAIHLTAVFVHEFALGHKLITPMITGTKLLGAEIAAGKHQFQTAFACLLLGLGLTYLIVNEI
ncbi:MAG: cytochrome b [Candidatus Azotimanducaceae bacterium]|jgi:cytochrome b